MGAKEEFKEQVIDQVSDAITSEDAEVMEANDLRSEVRKAKISAMNDSFTLLSQNTMKNSKFARLAINGHEVIWVIRDSDGEWFLSVDGKWADKSKITNDGELEEAYEIV